MSANIIHAPAKSSGAAHKVPGAAHFQIAWQTPHAVRRHTLSKASTISFPPGGSHFSVRCHAFQASMVFPYHLAAHPKPPGNTP